MLHMYSNPQRVAAVASCIVGQNHEEKSAIRKKSHCLPHTRLNSKYTLLSKRSGAVRFEFKKGSG